MKTIIVFILAIVMHSYTLGQGVMSNTSGSANPDSSVWAKKAELVYNATSASEEPYFNSTRDTLFSRAKYVTINWTIDSSMVVSGLTKCWFRTTFDTIAVDTLWGVVEHSTSAVVRVLWGVSSKSMTDSCSDLTVSSTTVGTSSSSTKKIPPFNQVYIKLGTVTGAVGDLVININGRRRW